MNKLNEQIELNKVAHVYSGKDGKCCCGCSGKHTYASAHAVWGSQHRGYEVTDDEINDRTVKLIVNKMNKAIANGALLDDNTDQLACIVIGERLYIAYFRTDDDLKTYEVVGTKLARPDVPYRATFKARDRHDAQTQAERILGGFGRIKSLLEVSRSFDRNGREIWVTIPE